jgi:hypothetical protein
MDNLVNKTLVSLAGRTSERVARDGTTYYTAYIAAACHVAVRERERERERERGK